MIDLRSDTVTTPTEEMLDAMRGALVGDDVFGEDPTVNELQECAAELLGKEAALFVPSGTMGNQICLALHCQPGDEAIVEGESHIFHYETGGPSIIARVQLHCIPTSRGAISPEQFEAARRTSEYYFPKTALVCLENTHNRHGGTILALSEIQRLEHAARAAGAVLHCDGARLWNACAETGLSPAEYASPFDTLSVCLSKGLGAPVGSLIVGKTEHIARARKWRKILGGGMRQAGFLAAAGLHALRRHRDFLSGDHKNAKSFAAGVGSIPGLTLQQSAVETNIVLFSPENMRTSSISELLEHCSNNGLALSRGRGQTTLRAVFHFQVSEKQTEEAVSIVAAAAERCFA